MLTQSRVLLRRETTAVGAARLAAPQHLNVSNVPIDVRVTPLGERVGAKRPATVDLIPGGMGANGGRVAVANGIECGIAGVQASGDFAALFSQAVSAAGFRPMLIERPGVRGALTIAMPNGRPGVFDLDIQRMEPLTASEFAAYWTTVAGSPNSVFMGPMQTASDTLDLHLTVARLATQRALMVHPSLLRDERLFATVGRLYGFAQMNAAEAVILSPSTPDIAKLACRVRFLLGDDTEFAITNGGDGGGLIWAEHRWLRIRPPRLQRTIVSDTGAGDVWGAAFCLSRWYYGTTPDEAADYAARAVAAWLTGEAIPPLRP
jgi:sugar/nucleoside kinase (ribokinase family)